jgi:hypothetical protein
MDDRVLDIIYKTITKLPPNNLGFHDNYNKGVQDEQPYHMQKG